MTNKLPCGCVPDASGFGYCSECNRKIKEKIWKNMSEDKKNYDRHFAPDISKELDNTIDNYDDGEGYEGCSCHIDPPCSYCMNKNNEDEE